MADELEQQGIEVEIIQIGQLTHSWIALAVDTAELQRKSLVFKT